MNRERPQAFADEKKNRHFFLGDSDSEPESDEECYRSRSFSGSESEDASLIGGAPSNLPFTVDDDCDDESLSGRNGNSSSDQIIPIRSIAFEKKKSFSVSRNNRRQFHDFYKLTDDHLGAGAYASVQTAFSFADGKEYAVKLVDKHEPGHTRSRILREVEIFKMCRNHPNIVQLVEWFEDENYFYMVFEKMRGGPLLNHIQRRVCFTEQEASMVTKDIVTAIKYLHDRGVAHRDIKPENILCTDIDRVSPVKLCDLDLASKPSRKGVRKTSRHMPSVASEPDLASPVGSAEFMAPEVVDAFYGDALKYDKRCDLWSVGIIVYILLCGYTPFYGECDRENCGWDQGKPCNDCQENLFHRIQRGEFDFPHEDWVHISSEAKDLISHLLVKNVRDRYTAVDVLNHPWIAHGAPQTPLQTASNLFRNDSARDIHQMNEHFNVMNRYTVARLSGLEESVGSAPSSPEESKIAVENLVPTEKLDARVPPLPTPNTLRPIQPFQQMQPIIPLISVQHDNISNGQRHVAKNNNCLNVVVEARGKRSLTPNYEPNTSHAIGDVDYNGMRWNAIGKSPSIRMAFSQIALETCQDAVKRRDSVTEMRHNRETEVNV